MHGRINLDLLKAGARSGIGIVPNNNYYVVLENPRNMYV